MRGFPFNGGTASAWQYLAVFGFGGILEIVRPPPLVISPAISGNTTGYRQEPLRTAINWTGCDFP